MILNFKMHLRRFTAPEAQQLLPSRGIVAHHDTFRFGQNSRAQFLRRLRDIERR